MGISWEFHGNFMVFIGFHRFRMAFEREFHGIFMASGFSHQGWEITELNGAPANAGEKTCGIFQYIYIYMYIYIMYIYIYVYISKYVEANTRFLLHIRNIK